MEFTSHPFGTQITEKSILSEMQDFTSWEEKYRFVIQLGKQLPSMTAEQREQCELISGCESQVWFSFYKNKNRVYFFADSDARIVKGLLALLLVQCQGKDVESLSQIEFQNFFNKIHLLPHLSESRHAGIQSIIHHIKNIN